MVVQNPDSPEEINEQQKRQENYRQIAEIAKQNKKRSIEDRIDRLKQKLKKIKDQEQHNNDDDSDRKQNRKKGIKEPLSRRVSELIVAEKIKRTLSSSSPDIDQENRPSLESSLDDIYENPLPTPREYREIILRTEMQLRELEVIIFADKIEEKKSKEATYASIEEATQIAITLLRIKRDLPATSPGAQFIDQLMAVYLESAKKVLDSKHNQRTEGSPNDQQLDEHIEIERQEDENDENGKDKNRKKRYYQMLKTLQSIQEQEEQTEDPQERDEALNDLQEQLDKIQLQRLRESQRQSEKVVRSPASIDQSRQERAKRVANYRDIRRIEQRLKRLKSKGRTEDETEIRALKAQRIKLLFDQINSLSTIELQDEEDTQTEEVLDEPATTLLDEILNESTIADVIYDNSLPLLESEKSKFQRLKELLEHEELQEFINKIKKIGSRRAIERHLINNPNMLTRKQREFLELISTPELSARIEYLHLHLQEQEESKISQKQLMINSIQTILEFERFKRIGDIETRIRLAREEFSSRLMADLKGGLTLLDLEMILKEYNLASIDYPEEKDDEPTLVFSPNIPEKSQEEITKMFSQAKRILEQYHTTRFYLETIEQDTEEAENKKRSLVKALDQDLEIILHEITGQRPEEETQEKFNALSTLLDKGVLRIVASPTGFSIIIETLFIEQDEEAEHALYQLLNLLGQQGREKSVKELGLGVTITSDLNNLTSQVNQKYNLQIVPSVNILLLPQTAFQENTYEMLQRHETQDYIISKIDFEGQDVGTPEASILREFISKTIDGSLFTNDGKEIAQKFLEEMEFYFKQNGADVETQKQLYELFLITRDAIAQLQNELTIEDIQYELWNDFLQDSIRIEVASILKEIILNHLSGKEQVDIARISEELRKRFNIETSYNLDEFGAVNTNDNSEQLAINRYFTFSRSGSSSTIGIISPSGNMNKARTTAQAEAPFGGHPAPPPYGKEGTLSNEWPYTNDSSIAYSRLGALQPFRLFRRLGRPIRHIPILGSGMQKIGSSVMNIPVPMFGLGGSKAAQYRAAFLAYSKDPLLRKIAKQTYGGAELGANPTKLWGNLLNSPDLEFFVKEYLPGLYVTQINELREYSQEMNKFGIYDVKKKLPSWLMQLMISDIGIPQSNAVRYLAEAIPGIKFTYEAPQGHQIRFDDDELRKIRRARDFIAWDQFRQKQTGGFQNIGTRMAPKYRYDYDYNKNRKKRYDGFVASLFAGAILKRPSKAQKEVKEFFSKHARRRDLPKSIRNLFHWERKIGSKFREYLKKRDGLLAIQTLEHEAEYANARRGEDYNLFALMNLIALAENVTDQDAWLRNDTNRTIKIRFRRNGKIQTAEIAPGEHLLDPDGNLIFKDIKLKTENGRFVLDDEGMLQVKESDINSQMLWRRLVGDWENPHLRFIRLQSRKAQKQARKLFGEDPDEGFPDPTNIMLRTDGIKKMISNLYMEQLNRIMRLGVAPDRRYLMLRTEDGESLIDFYDGLFQNTRDEISSNDIATDKFKEDLISALELLAQRMKSQSSYIEELIKEIEGTKELTRKKASEIIESVLAITQGKKNPLIDSIFSSFVKFSDDPTWESPYRTELPGIEGLAAEEIENIHGIISESVSAMQEKYNQGQKLLYQWQKAYFQASQFERVSAGKSKHYKGMALQLTRFTNLAMLVSFGIMAISASSLAANSFILSLGLRIFAKPWAVKQQKMWGARQLQALQKAKEMSTIDGIFQAAIEGRIPNKHELTRMEQTIMELFGFLEEIATAKPDDDWYPKNDSVINKAANTLAWAQSKLDD